MLKHTYFDCMYTQTFAYRYIYYSHSQILPLLSHFEYVADEKQKQYASVFRISPYSFPRLVKDAQSVETTSEVIHCK